jgi:hypothetical protein
MSLTTEQRDALRQLDKAVSRLWTNGETVAALAKVREAFADALHPPKMATRVHVSGAGFEYRVVRTASGDVIEMRDPDDEGDVFSPNFPDRDENDVLLAAARDTEFHEVTD